MNLYIFIYTNKKKDMLCKKCQKEIEDKPVSKIYCSTRCRNQVQSSESYYELHIS